MFRKEGKRRGDVGRGGIRGGGQSRRSRRVTRTSRFEKEQNRVASRRGGRGDGSRRRKSATHREHREHRERWEARQTAWFRHGVRCAGSCGQGEGETRTLKKVDLLSREKLGIAKENPRVVVIRQQARPLTSGRACPPGRGALLLGFYRRLENAPTWLPQAQAWCVPASP